MVVMLRCRHDDGQLGWQGVYYQRALQVINYKTVINQLHLIMIKNIKINFMILKHLKRTVSLHSLYRCQFGVLFLQDQFCRPPFDVLITDISSGHLSGHVSKLLKKEYLSSLLSNQQEFEKIRNGIIYGHNHRGMISLPTSSEKKTPIWVHYLIHTGSPYTFLSSQALSTLLGPKQQFNDIVSLKLNGIECEVGVSTTHFEQVNLIGMDYLMKTKKYHIDIAKRSVCIQM